LYRKGKRKKGGTLSVGRGKMRASGVKMIGGKNQIGGRKDGGKEEGNC